MSLIVIALILLRLHHAVLHGGNKARTVSVLENMSLTDEVSKDIGSSAIVLHLLCQIVPLGFKAIVIGCLLLDLNLFLLGKQSQSIQFLPGSTTLSADL